MGSAARKARKRDGRSIEREPKVSSQKYRTRAEQQQRRRRDRDAAALTWSLAAAVGGAIAERHFRR